MPAPCPVVGVVVVGVVGVGVVGVVVAPWNGDGFAPVGSCCERYHADQSAGALKVAPARFGFVPGLYCDTGSPAGWLSQCSFHTPNMSM